MALNIIPESATEKYNAYNCMLRVLSNLNCRLTKIDLTKDITSFKHFKKLTPKKAIWLYKLARKWMYSDSELDMKGLVNLNLRKSKDDVLMLSDSDFDVLEKLITESQRLMVYEWKCEEFGL